MNTKYTNLTSNLPRMHVAGKKVLLRADLNLPSLQTTGHEYRLRALLPTLNFLRQQKSYIILVTHRGRPEGKIVPELSTRSFIPLLQQAGFQVEFAPTPEAAASITCNTQHPQLVLLENVRFFPGEQQHDIAFARTLRALADYYINDAFALSHRTDTSVTLTAQLFEPHQRSIGFLIERELAHLTQFFHAPRPRLLVLGGGKVATKLPLLPYLFEHIDIVHLCPAVVFTFMKALQYNVGISLVEQEQIAHAQEIMRQAEKKGISLLLPQDFLVSYHQLAPPFFVVPAEKLTDDALGISIGPKTLTYFQRSIRTVFTIFFNGPMGFTEYPQTMRNCYALLRCIAQQPGYTVIGGGDSIAAADQAGVLDAFKYVSTGGGATLAFLAGQPLPALDVFL